MAEGEKFLRREMAIRKLVAEEHTDDCGDRERIQNPGLLPWRKVKAGQVSKNQRQPGSPNKELEHHHEEKFEARSIIHSLLMQGKKSLLLTQAPTAKHAHE